MEQFITSLPNTLIGWISTTMIVVAGLVSALSFIRRNDLKLLRETNTDLRQAHQDNQAKIAELEQSINTLRSDFETLRRANMTLENLVKSALLEYFKLNPKEARKIA